MPDQNGNLLPGDEGYVAPVPQPGDADYVDPNYVTPSQQPNAEPPVLEAPLDSPVVEVPEETVINPDAQVDPDVEPPIPPVQEGGDNPEPPESLDEDDFKSNSEVADTNDADLPGEQTVDEAGRPAGFNPFYHGDAVVHPENEILYQMESSDFEANKNRENR